MGLEKPNSGPDPGETFFPNSVSDLGTAETFQISRNVGPVIDENVCLLDSQPSLPPFIPGGGGTHWLAGEGGGPNVDEGTDTVVGIYRMYFALKRLNNKSKTSEC